MPQTLTYTPRDQVDTTVDKRGEGERSIFDERGRVIAKETMFGGSVLGRTETGYDRLGRVVRSVNEAGNVACIRTTITAASRQPHLPAWARESTNTHWMLRIR